MFHKLHVLLLLMLCGCATNCRNWYLDRTHPGCGKLYYPTENCFNGIKVDFIFIQGSCRVYLDIYTFQFPEDYPEHSRVVISFGDHSFEFNARILEGYQRLLLPEEASALLIEALQSGHSICIQVGCHKQRVESSGFGKYFKRLARK